MKDIELTAVFEPSDEGGYMAYIQEIHGINSQGETVDEAKDNLVDAINLMFQELRQSKAKSKTKKHIIQTLHFSF